MATKYIVDAHTLLWYVAGDPQLGAAAKVVLLDPHSELILPATAPAEACWTIQRGRVATSIVKLLAAIDKDSRVVIAPLDRAIIERSNGLTSIEEMHDRQIVATALVLADQGAPVALLTKDANITASGLVPVIW